MKLTIAGIVKMSHCVHAKVLFMQMSRLYLCRKGAISWARYNMDITFPHGHRGFESNAILKKNEIYNNFT